MNMQNVVVVVNYVLSFDGIKLTRIQGTIATCQVEKVSLSRTPTRSRER